MTLPLIDSASDAVSLVALRDRSAFEAWAQSQPSLVRSWLQATNFVPEPGSTALIPAEDGLACVLVMTGDGNDPFRFAPLAFGLLPGTYQVEGTLSPETATAVALGWALGAYRFTRYRKADRAPSTLVWPEGADRATVRAMAEATYMTRDLINIPAEDMGPAHLARAAEQLAAEHEARVSLIVGDDLLTNNYPMIHAVGRGSSRPPILIDLNWGDRSAPKVTLVGKGVCFDSGGYDLKPAASMLMMKKDMGGAAQVLGLAQMIMAAALPIRLRVLVPAVENMVAGNAFKPMDVLTSRRGLTVEIGNTDAEGRLVLADALAEAADDDPEMILDFATLTGAARVALGTDLPALFCNDDRLADDILAASRANHDPLWRMPLFAAYAGKLKSGIADLSNMGDGPAGGAITAALFMERFLKPGTPWAHIDLMAWNVADRPGRPRGGEAQGIRAVFGMLAKRYPK